VILAVDVSGSADYGSVSLSKREVAAETAAVLGFSALHNGDKVGLLIFADEPLLFIPPEKGSRHLLRMIREILVANPENPAPRSPPPAISWSAPCAASRWSSSSRIFLRSPRQARSASSPASTKPSPCA
jgi:uncharacterized protein (DUF58 family)